MRALRYARYGRPEVLQLCEVADPVPRSTEVIVRVRAAGLNPKDAFLRKGKPAWTRVMAGRLPRGVGFDFAGEREDTGERVYGMINGFRGATCAERVAVPAGLLAPIPSSLSFTEAAAMPLVMLTALQALRDDGKLPLAGKVLVFGGSGGVGSAAIQLARVLGASEVTSVSGSANRPLCLSLGATIALDYRTDVLPPSGSRFDVVFDTMGAQTFRQWRDALTSTGALVGTVPAPGFLVSTLTTAFAPRRARLAKVQASAADLRALNGWVEAGKLRPVIDSVFALAAAAEAFARLESRRARGKIVLEIA